MSNPTYQLKQLSRLNLRHLNHVNPSPELEVTQNVTQFPRNFVHQTARQE